MPVLHSHSRTAIVKSSLLIYGAFIVCAALGMLLNPEAFHKFFSPVQLVPDANPPSLSKNYYWDVKFYAQMVLGNQCGAFYPLWSLLIRILFHPQTVDQAAHTLLVVSTVIFLISIPLFLWIFTKEFKKTYLAFVLILAFSLNPMAIFRVIGYTESLFSVLSAVFIWICLRQTKLNNKVRLLLVLVVTFLMSLTRPILIQMIFSSVAALGTIFVFEKLKLGTRDWRAIFTQRNQYAQEIQLTIIICLSALLGYCPYGFFCLSSRGDFFAPFNDQKYWASKTGIHPELLLFPKSPLFDLLGLYFPVIILFVAIVFIYFKIKAQNPFIWIPKSPLWNGLILYPPLLVVLYAVNYLKAKNKSAQNKNCLTKLVTYDYTKTLSKNYVFWFCIYFSVAHCLIVLLTRDRLYSLARFIFASPFFFMALGYLYRCIPGKRKYQTLWWFIIISAFALIEQWVNYGQNKWLG